MQMFALGCIALFALILATVAVKKKNPGRQATRKRMQPRVSPVEVRQRAVSQTDEADLEPLLEDPFEESARLITPEAVAPEPVEYIVLHVMMPKGQGYGGYPLLQTLLSLGFRSGKDKLFHRHAQKDGRGEKLFSLATANQPGTFDFQDINEFFCPGVTLFMVLKQCSQPQEAFALMLHTAENLVEELGGEVLDETREPLNESSLKALQDRVAVYQAKAHPSDLFIQA